jgi:putative phosphoribosyl transferase
VPAGPVGLEGELHVPGRAHGLVLFAHGSGSSRHSPRNRAVAKRFQEMGLATLLMDLLSKDEEVEEMHTRHLRFDINLLADRLISAVVWLNEYADTQNLKIGLFGASTGAAAALVAAAHKPKDVYAVVSRGGRPDLAGDALPQVQAPTLLIVGGNDFQVIDLNKQAMESMECQVKLEIIPRATHLFSEPGALERVALLAGQWFVDQLADEG